VGEFGLIGFLDAVRVGSCGWRESWINWIFGHGALDHVDSGELD